MHSYLNFKLLYLSVAFVVLSTQTISTAQAEETPPDAVSAESETTQTEQIAQRIQAAAKRDMLQVQRNELALMETRMVPDFQDKTLREAMVLISEKLNLPIHFDEVALEAGISTPDDPITFVNPTSINIEHVFDFILTKKELSYAVKPDYILISTIDEASTKTIRTYQLDSTSLDDPTQIIDLIQTVIPGEWDLGEDVIRIYEDKLVVFCPLAAHRHIRDLFLRLQ